MKLIYPLLRGIVIGIANIIPGVSGGTMMVSMGIYDTLIDAITHLFSHFRRSVQTLLPYAAGMLIGIFTLTSLLTFCFTHAPLPTATAFIGLILGGLAPLVHRIDKKRLNSLAILLFIAFFTLILVMALTNPAQIEGRININAGEVLMLLIMGMVASATMLVPGVSGSMVLLLFGYYRPVLASLNDFKNGLLGGNWALAAQQMLILLPFCVGVLLGIYFIAQLIGYLLRRWPAHTYCAVLGLVVASPIAILLRTEMAGISVVTILSSIATFAAGFLVAAWLARQADAECVAISQEKGSGHP